MTKSDIPQEHVTHFMALCDSLKKSASLNEENIRTMLTSTRCKKYPDAEQSLIFAAGSDKNKYGEYQTAVGVISPPHYRGINQPLIEISLGSFSNHGAEAPVAWAVFPDNRQILTISGLILDTKGDQSRYQANSLYADRSKFNQAARDLIIAMIDLFPASEESQVKSFVFDAKADLLRV